MSSAGQFIECLLQFPGDRAGLSVADGTEIDFAQANHFGGSAAHEDLVGNVELVARNGLFDNVVAEVARQRNQAVAGDALEYRAAGHGVNHTIAHYEDIFASAFGNV